MKPRGIRNKNPGNIRWGDPWQGLVPVEERTDKSFCQFVSCPYGIRALARVLITYQDKHRLDTIAKIITRWAPPNENDTGAYIVAVAQSMGCDKDLPLDMQRYEDIKPLVAAIIRHENGRGPLRNDNTWYERDVIDKGLMLAGIEAPAKAVGKVPVTKETVGATTVGSIGAVGLFDTLPRIIESIGTAGSKLPWQTTGMLIAAGVLVAVAVLIAWSQVAKYRRNIS